MSVDKFPTTNPKLLILEELGKVAEMEGISVALSEDLNKLLTVERYQAVADANSIYHRALWNTVLRFVAWNQHKLPPASVARIRHHISKIRKSNVPSSA